MAGCVIVRPLISSTCLNFLDLQMQSYSSNKIKGLIIIFYLIVVNVPFSGNVQATYTEKMKKYAELNTEVKQKRQVGAMYTVPATI